MSRQPPTLKTYDDAAAFLMSLTDNERRLGSPDLTYTTRDFDILRFRQGLEGLGSPHRSYAVVHAAGTKGKGSTCALVESALRACGLKTGLYTSPHLSRFTERIRISGVEMDGAVFAELVHELADAGLADRGGAAGFRTVFEMLTAAALVAFARAGVDVAVVETGLGGRLDSTNVFNESGEKPHVSVITSIGLDHTSILGDTIKAIAAEKAGIIHGHAQTVLAPQPPAWADDVHDVIAERVREAHGVLLDVAALLEATPVLTGTSSDNAVVYKLTEAGAAKFDVAAPLASALATGMSVQLPLWGRHQRGNGASALVALLALERTGKLPGLLTGEKVAHGLESTCWPGRVEVVSQNPAIIVDGAHCPLSVRALSETVADIYPKRAVHLVCGFLRDKNIGQMLEVAAQGMPVKSVGVTTPDGPRALDVREATELAATAFPDLSGAGNISEYQDVAGAMNVAVSRARIDNGLVVVFGSLYLVADARAAAVSISAGRK